VAAAYFDGSFQPAESPSGVAEGLMMQEESLPGCQDNRFKNRQVGRVM